MTDRGSLIVFAFFFVTFVTLIKKKAKENAQKNLRKRQDEAVNRQVGITDPRKAFSATQSRPRQTGSPAPARVSAQGSGQGSAVQKKDLSTTGMLAEKARQDQIEHRKEEFEHKKHEERYYGSYTYAKRYLLGDPVSPTEKLIYCPNCAAENLLKLHENPARYNCYFCREKLG